MFRVHGAYERNRTGDLFLTKEVLYLLSYVGALIPRGTSAFTLHLASQDTKIRVKCANNTTTPPVESIL